VPPDWDARLAGREAPGRSRRRGASGADGAEVIASDHSPQPQAAEWPQEQSARELGEPGWSDRTGQFRAALTSFGPRQARELHRRLARWRPAYWPLVLFYLAIVVCDAWFADPFVGPDTALAMA
jgi:hypothetical protein